jgi:hypothetical protein
MHASAILTALSALIATRCRYPGCGAGHPCPRMTEFQHHLYKASPPAGGGPRSFASTELAKRRKTPQISHRCIFESPLAELCEHRGQIATSLMARYEAGANSAQSSDESIFLGGLVVRSIQLRSPLPARAAGRAQRPLPRVFRKSVSRASEPGWPCDINAIGVSVNRPNRNKRFAIAADLPNPGSRRRPQRLSSAKRRWDRFQLS